MNWKQRVLNSPLYDLLGKRSFAQAGEDMIVWSELRAKRGFYVDIGAYHPKQFSNTYYLYKRGWKGIVVEPNPEMVGLYKKIRSRDIALGVGVGEKNGVADYFMFSDPAVNTFDAETAKKNKQVGRKLLGKKPVAILRLEKILSEYLPKDTKIDLLSVDTEGKDEEVLSSNDWSRYRPKMVIAEDLDFDWEKPVKSGICRKMRGWGYKLVGLTPYSQIFKDQQKEK